jgi:hypothetical protein
MTHKNHSIRVKRSYLTIATFIGLFIGSGFSLLATIQSRGSTALVFLLAVLTLAFFFLTFLAYFSPYLRVDDDRIIIHHDLLRKDVLFFYDLTRIEIENDHAVALYHLNGLTRVVFRKFNRKDREEVLAFFKELMPETV